jgi:hypothetical protein
MGTIYFFGAILVCSIIAMISGIFGAKTVTPKDVSPEMKVKLIKAYGDSWHIAGLLCNEEGWIKWYEYNDRLPQNYKTKTIDGVVCYRPKLD